MAVVGSEGMPKGAKCGPDSSYHTSIPGWIRKQRAVSYPGAMAARKTLAVNVYDERVVSTQEKACECILRQRSRQDGGYGDDRTMMSSAFCKWDWKFRRAIA